MGTNDRPSARRGAAALLQETRGVMPAAEPEVTIEDIGGGLQVKPSPASQPPVLPAPVRMAESEHVAFAVRYDKSGYTPVRLMLEDGKVVHEKDLHEGVNQESLAYMYLAGDVMLEYSQRTAKPKDPGATNTGG
jgi:hypothetical protein